MANAMPSIITEIVFSEPSGRPLALVHLCGALVLSGTFGYYVVVEGATPVSAVVSDRCDSHRRYC